MLKSGNVKKNQLNPSDFYLFLQIDQRRSELAKVTQCGIGAADWQKRNESGYSINKEPLKSFCKVNIKIDLEKYRVPAEAEKYLVVLEIRQEYALLWTAYPIERQHTEEKLLKEYEDYKKARTA